MNTGMLIFTFSNFQVLENADNKNKIIYPLAP